MGLFGIGKKKQEIRSETVEQQQFTPFTDSLLFGNLYNRYSGMNVSSVYRAVEIISDSVAMLPIRVKINEDSRKEDVVNHPLNLIFSDKNATMTKYNFIKLLIQSVLLKGNGFAYIQRATDGTVIGLQFLEDSDVTINYNKFRPDELCYNVPIVSNQRIEPCNMIHLKKNSYDGVKGISVISYAARALGIANSTENSAQGFFTNGCNLSGVLTVEGQLTDKQKQDIRASWNSAYTNGGNGLAVLQGNMKYQPIQLSAADSQLLESRRFNVQDIARFFGISPILLGDLSAAGYSTIEATQQQFLLHTLQPYIVMVEEEFTKKLLKPSEKKLEVNLDETALLKTNKEALAGYYGSLIEHGILSINEVRKELGYSAIEGGNQHNILFVDVNKTNINKEDNK